MDKVTMKFETDRILVKFIECDGGESGYIVFTRIKDDWDKDDVDPYNKYKSAIARYSYIVMQILCEDKNNK